MLRRLRVQNFALIENLDLTFSSGLNVFTGETGAGKSIIIGALNLLFGDRASSELFREGEDFLLVEGNFDIGETSEDLLIRREMQRGGKSFVFINDRQVTLQTLIDTTANLAEIMGQHQHQKLFNAAEYIKVIDRFGDLQNASIAFGELLSDWKGIKSEIDGLLDSRRERLNRVEFLKYQLTEIESAMLTADEEEQLNRQRHVLKNASALKELASSMYHNLYDAEDSAYSRASRCRALYQQLVRIDREFPVRADDLDNLCIIAEEIAKAAASYSESIEDDPARLEWIESRLAEIERLKNKYGADIAGILQFAEEIKGELEISENFDARILQLRHDLELRTTELIKSGKKLDESRLKAAKKLSSKLKQLLSFMGMEEMEFQATFDKPESGIEINHDGVAYVATDSGFSQIEFLISPNPGEGFKPLKKIASGGELSRIMLSIKTALAKNDNIKLLIFDEVDNGIGGEVAIMVGKLLKELSSSHQLICITHLQQIASKAESHFAVDKETVRNRTRTLVRKLDGKEKVREIARLISGDANSESSLEFAQKLISENDGKSRAHRGKN